jgi:tetratricopeptide (TPR) repeat protein
LGIRWLALIALMSLPAFGASKANQLAKEGDKLYKEGKYREAAEVLKKAYDLDKNPVFLFNIARAYDQAGDVQVALDTYRQYVALPETDPTLLKRANLAMDRLRTLVANADAAKAQQEEAAKKLKEEADAAKAKAEAEADAARKQRDELQKKERERQEAERSKVSGRRVAAIAVGGLAVVGAGLGVTFGLLSSSAKSSFVNATTLDAKKSFESSTKTFALVADVSYAAALVSAIVFAIIFPWRGAEPEGHVQVAVSPLGIGLGGTF